jgi:hypothetical protein
VAAGVLALAGSGAINASPVIGVQAGAVLDISGVDSPATLGASVAQSLTGLGTVNLGAKTLVMGANATLAPGTSPGTLGFSAVPGGSLEFAAGSGAAFELGLPANSDRIVFDSAGDWLAGSGNATLALSLLGGFDYTNVYPLFENVTTAGFTFAAITGFDDANYLANLTQTGSQIDLSFTVIPEPGGAGLALLATLALARRRRA